MTADTLGGVWTYALVLARALAGRGLEVVLAAMGAPLDAAQRAQAAATPGLRVEEGAFRLEWMDEPWDDVAAAGRWLLGLERRLEPDVVHLNGYCHGALPWRAPTLVVGHSCVLSWWEAVKGEAAPERYARYRTEVARGLAAAGLVVAPTRAMLGALERHYGPLPRACVIPNARAAADFPPGPKEPFVLAAGRLWDEAKGLGALDAVAARLPWPVRVAGPTRHPGGSGGEVHARHLHLLGALEPAALARLMGRAALYAHPARYEPFGLGVLEAALAGCALVLGDIPSLREVWGEAALYVPPGDTHALEDALRGLCEAPGRRALLAAAARARALELTPGRVAGRYLAAYAAALASAGAARGAPPAAAPAAPEEAAPV